MTDEEHQQRRVGAAIDRIAGIDGVIVDVQTLESEVDHPDSYTKFTLELTATDDVFEEVSEE